MAPSRGAFEPDANAECDAMIVLTLVRARDRGTRVVVVSGVIERCATRNPALPNGTPKREDDPLAATTACAPPSTLHLHDVAIRCLERATGLIGSVVELSTDLAVFDDRESEARAPEAAPSHGAMTLAQQSVGEAALVGGARAALALVDVDGDAPENAAAIAATSCRSDRSSDDSASAPQRLEVMPLPRLRALLRAHAAAAAEDACGTLVAFALRLADSVCSDVRPSDRPVAPLVVISDPGQDQDDEMAFILMRALRAKGLVEPVAVVANLRPARQRARLARGTFDVLGLASVPVATGSDGGSAEHVDTFSETAGAYMPPEHDYVDEAGGALLERVFVAAPRKGLDVLCISSLKDAAAFLREHEALFVEKARSVTIMGGVEPFDERDEGKLLVPDTAQNNVFDKAAAAFFYRRCQELGVPLVVVSRHAAYKCPMPRTIYDDMARTGHPIGRRLRDSQRTSIEHLWKRAASPEGVDRLGLPMRCDKAWFCNTFCRGQGLERTADESIWDLIVSFNMYDPMALLCAVDSTRCYFKPTVKRVLGVDHLVVGTSPDSPGVHDETTEELRDFLYANFLRGITMDFSEFEGTFEA